jgi:hypothetical protein
MTNVLPLTAKDLAPLGEAERKQVTSALDSLAALDPHRDLNEQGWKRESAKYTGHAYKALAARHSTNGTEIKAVTARLGDMAKEVAAKLTLSDGERTEATALGNVYRSLPQADKDRLIEDWFTGKDDRGSRLIAGIHPAVAGVTPQTQDRLKVRLSEQFIDHEAVDEATRKLDALKQERAALVRVMDAFESVTDRATLRAVAGSTLLHRGDMDDAAKSRFISERGLQAFKELPA